MLTEYFPPPIFISPGSLKRGTPIFDKINMKQPIKTIIIPTNIRAFAIFTYISFLKRALKKNLPKNQREDMQALLKKKPKETSKLLPKK